VFIGGIDPIFRDNYYLSNASMYPGVLIHAFLFEQLLDWQKYNYTAKLVTDNLVFIFFVGLVFWSFYVIISSYWQKLIYILFFWVVFFYMVSFRVFSINFGIAFLFLSVLVWSGENIVQNWLLKDILKKYTPTFLWNFIEDGQNLDHIEDYRDVAVMFSDIRNFTAKSEENEDLMLNLLGECLELQSSIVFNNYGTVDKFIGDAVMAYWTGKDAVGNSLLAACQIIQKLKQNEFISNNGIEIGIGINYGKANLKNFGSKENKNFTLFGDSVNIASRIENLNKIYQTRILITEDSINTISEEQRKLFVFGQIDTIRPKGKKMPIKIYEIYAYYDGHSWFEISRQKRPINDKYEEGLDLYYKGDFERALERFKMHPKITKFKLMIERCYKLLIKKPDNWKGVWEYKGK
jgi:adenylate cyclase